MAPVVSSVDTFFFFLGGTILVYLYFIILTKNLKLTIFKKGDILIYQPLTDTPVVGSVGGALWCAVALISIVTMPQSVYYTDE